MYLPVINANAWKVTCFLMLSSDLAELCMFFDMQKAAEINLMTDMGMHTSENGW